MSIKYTSAVWKHFRQGGNVKLALLCLADYANEHGIAWPSMVSVGQRICCSESQARRAVHRVLATGVVEVVGNLTGGAPGSSRRYRILIDRLTPSAGATRTPGADDTRTPSADDTPSAGATPSADARDPLHGCAPTPGTGDTRTVIESPRTTKAGLTPDTPPPGKKGERHTASKLRKPARFKTSLREGFAISDRVRRWAKERRFDAHLEQHFEVFIGSVKAHGAEYVDWDQALMNCIRDDWSRIRSKANGGRGEPVKPEMKCAFCSEALTGGYVSTDKGLACHPCSGRM